MHSRSTEQKYVTGLGSEPGIEPRTFRVPESTWCHDVSQSVTVSQCDKSTVILITNGTAKDFAKANAIHAVEIKKVIVLWQD